MYNRENIRVRPLSEELEGIGLDPERVMSDIEHNAGLLESVAGSPPSSEAVRGRLVEDEDVELDDDEEGVLEGAAYGPKYPVVKVEDKDMGKLVPMKVVSVSSHGNMISLKDKYGNLHDFNLMGNMVSGGNRAYRLRAEDVKKLLRISKNEELELDDEELEEEEMELFDEAIVRVKKGYRKDPKTGKMVKVSLQQKRKEKAARRKKKGQLRAASKAYRKRFKSKIAKRRKRLAKSGKQKKGFITRMESTVAAQLTQLREDLENSSASTGEVSPHEEAAINAGWLALLLGECFEAMGDVEAGEMLYAMSDSAAVLSESIEAVEGEMDEAIEAKLTSLLEGVSKALATHEDLGSPSLFESIEMGAENGLYEDEEEDDEELIDEDEGCDCDDLEDLEDDDDLDLDEDDEE